MSKLRPVGNKLVLQPLRRERTEGGILLVDRYNDDRQQWKVLERGAKVDPAIQPGCQVLTVQNLESDYEFTDGVVVADAKHVLVVLDANGS